MKTLIAASAIALISNAALAGTAWEDNWQNSDLDPRYGIGSTTAAPAPSGNEFATSLEAFGQGNPDLYSGQYSTGDEIRQMVDVSSGIGRTSLEAFNVGNPDHEDGLQWN